MSGRATWTPEVNPWIIAVAVMLGTFLEVLDTTVVNVSLPHIAGNLSASVDESTWVLTSYLVANGIVLPLTGWLANYFGRKRLLLFAVSGFTAASFLAGLSPNLPSLIVWRVIQGATGGALQPISQAILLEVFPPQDRGKAMAFWGLGIVVAPMLGPVLGGWLTDNYSWRWVFYINLPIGVAAFLMTSWFVSDPPYVKRSASRIDYWGIGMLAVGIAALQIVLDKGQEKDWFGTGWILALTFVAALCLVAFVVYELLITNPVLDLRVFKLRSYSTGVFLMTLLGFVLYASMVLIPLMLQTLLGYPAVQAGLAMLPRGMGAFLIMPIVAVLLTKSEPRKPLVAGMAISAFSLWTFSRLSLDAGYWDVFFPQLIQGIGIGLMFVPLTTAAHDPVPPQQMGNATSIFNLMRNLGGSMGIAAMTTLIDRHAQMHVNELGQNITAFNPAARLALNSIRAGLTARGSDFFTATREAYALIYGQIQRQAMMLSFVDAFWILALVFITLMPLVFVIRRPKAPGKAVAAH